MNELLASFLESLTPSGIGGSEAFMGGVQAPVSMGQQATDFIGGMMPPQIQQYQKFYNTATNPNISMGGLTRSGLDLAMNSNENDKSSNYKSMLDFYNKATDPNTNIKDVARSGFELSFNPNQDEKNLYFQQMPEISSGMANNYVGGIPSLLQNTGSGILPYIGSR
jgi:hypothetical protein